MDSLDELSRKELDDLIAEYEGASRVLKGLIYKYEDVLNVLDLFDSNQKLIQLAEEVNDCLQRIKDRTSTT